MPSETDVANAALRLLGASRITSFTDGSKEANAVQDLYEELRDDLLRSHPWNFATKRQKLAQSSTAPVYEFDHAYPLPSDWLRTIAVHDNDGGSGTFLYRAEQVGGQMAIVASADDVWLTYVSRVTDPNLMDVNFRKALEVALAREMAIDLTSSNTLEEQLSKRADRVLARARSADGMGGFPRQRPRGSWAMSRHGGWPARWPQ